MLRVSLFYALKLFVKLSQCLVHLIRWTTQLPNYLLMKIYTHIWRTGKKETMGTGRLIAQTPNKCVWAWKKICTPEEARTLFFVTSNYPTPLWQNCPLSRFAIILNGHQLAQLAGNLFCSAQVKWSMSYQNDKTLRPRFHEYCIRSLAGAGIRSPHSAVTRNPQG